MGKRVADQHAVMDRGWEVADELAEVVRELMMHTTGGSSYRDRAAAALRLYREARNG